MSIYQRLTLTVVLAVLAVTGTGARCYAGSIMITGVYNQNGTLIPATDIILELRYYDTNNVLQTPSWNNLPPYPFTLTPIITHPTNRVVVLKVIKKSNPLIFGNYPLNGALNHTFAPVIPPPVFPVMHTNETVFCASAVSAAPACPPARRVKRFRCR
jgi:hypothetical protein